jgi:ribonuclease J
MAKNKLRIIPLGGVGEIGRNMTLFEYGENIIVVDAGLMFPETDMFGVDIVIPDISYLVEHRDIVRGIIITHGHEDHHGALPYVLPHVQAPVYATRLTRGLIEVKLKESKLLEKAELHTIDSDTELNLGPFRLEFFHVSHSIPDAVGLAIGTPVGLAVHTGDYKFDYTPVDGQLTDFHKLAQFGSRGVLVLLADSTNADRPRYTPSEQEVSESFDWVFAQAEGRIIVATFASNIYRVQQVIDTAVKYERRVGVVGRSMVNNVKMAQELGYLSVPDNALLQLVELDKLPPREVAIVCTGTQGEPTSALVRMANEDHRHVKIQPGDTVILSATPIPGNEELVHRTLNNLFRLGAQVYYQDLLPVHVSGHASQEEQKLMLSLTQPKFFVPIQGEYRHLVLQAELARQMGIPRENIFVVESGQVLEFDERSGRVAETVDGGYVFVDGLGVGDVGTVVLRDRHVLSQDGFFIAVVAVDKNTGKLVEGPDIISRGFVYLRDSEELIEEARQQVIKALEKRGHSTALDDKIKEVLSRFLYEQTKRRPMILPVVMEV